MVTAKSLSIVPPGFKKKLDEYQYKAVTSGLGPKRCNAGAGSGKTQAYAHRVAGLVANGVKPENILAVTFTKKAAMEMKERIELVCENNEIEIDLKKMWIGTFHSLGIQACRQYAPVIGYSDKFTILDEDDQEALIKRLINENDSFQGIKLKYGDVVAAISYARNSGDDYLEVFSRKLTNISNHVAMVEVAHQYAAKKREMNSFDFDDMLVYWLEILKRSAEARNYFQDKFHYILVDEYQDTNFVQNEIIDILAAKHRNLFVVGDDWQSIYAFRAAEVRNIINFDKRYPDCETFVLANNYRSTPEIVNLASACIGKNANQLQKKVEAPNKSGRKPIVCLVSDEKQQVKHIINQIIKIHDKGVKYKDIAVLYRNNNSSVLLEKELNKRLIPYVKKGAQFWKKSHIKLALSWLKMIQNPLDNANIIRCVEMFDGVGKAAVNKLLQAFSDESAFEDFISGELIIDPKKPKLFEEFRQHIVNIEEILGEDETPVESAVNYISGFLTTYTLNHWKGKEGEERAEDFSVLIEMSDQFESIQELLEAIALQDERKKQKDRDEVTLSTGHGAKGLEWGIVFIIGLSDTKFPSKYVTTQEEMEEERRLFYVMLTRAKQVLYMFAPKKIETYGGGETIVAPSPFLQEMPEDLRDVLDLRDLP